MRKTNMQMQCLRPLSHLEPYLFTYCGKFISWCIITPALITGRPGGLNGHISPTSSTASELANHLGDPALSPRSHTTNNNSSHHKTLQTHSGQGRQSVSVDGLDSMLSKKLSQDPGLRLHIDQLESVSYKSVVLSLVFDCILKYQYQFINIQSFSFLLALLNAVK